MNFSQIKEAVLISDFLRKEGYYPVKKSGRELFYRSPLRNETRPSFTVNDHKGLWFDHGSGKGR